MAQTQKLPANYERAKAEIEACARIDECKDWADKAAAMASYAKQSQDETLLNLASKIRARAIKRCGQLMAEIEPGQGARDGKRGRGTPTPLNRSQAARAAGLSKDQQVTAIRVARVPDDEFEEMVEREKPATVTEIAKAGTHRTKRKSDSEQAAARAATKAAGALRRFAEMTDDVRPSEASRGALPQETGCSTRACARSIRRYRKARWGTKVSAG